LDAIEEMLLKQLHAKFDIRPQLEDSLSLLGVDSIGMAELTVDIEKQFGFRVDDDILSVETVQQLADYIRERTASNKSNNTF
jgi:acyl carrier protein